MDKEIKTAEFISKETTKVPKGAKILKKSVRVSVEEIENGFLIVKSYDITYELKERKDYLYFSKKTFSETNPLKIEEDKMLADLFD